MDQPSADKWTTTATATTTPDPPSEGEASSCGPGMKVFTSVEPTGTGALRLQAIVGEGCMFVWVGADASPPEMGALCVGTMTRFDSLPVLSTLLPGGDDDASQTMAQRLSKKLGFMVLASCSVPIDDDTISPIATLEKRLLEYITTLA